MILASLICASWITSCPGVGNPCASTCAEWVETEYSHRRHRVQIDADGPQYPNTPRWYPEDEDDDN